jgi:ADP-L-glycero-D-manno-heptose 6-epimerase
VSAVFAAMNKEAKIEFIEMPEYLQAKYQYFTEAETAKLRAAGYERPFTSLEDGVREYVAEYLSKREA